MEEDIEIIQNIIYNQNGDQMNYIDIDNGTPDNECETFITAIENLLSGYKQLEKENKELLEVKISASAHNRIMELEEENKQLEAIKDEAIRRYNFESIPISLVKENIEELDKTIEEVEENIKNTTDEEKRYWKKEKHDLCMQKYILQDLLERSREDE